MDYTRFYEETYNYLILKAKEHNIDETELEKYFAPNNTGLPEENGVNDISRLFKRICFHAQNMAMTSGVINFNKNYSIIKSVACEFNVDEFLGKYKSYKEVYEEIIKYLPEGTKRSTKTGRTGPSKKLLYAKSMYSGAKMLSEFNSYDDFINQMLAYGDFAPEFIKYNVDGFGDTMPCDLLKELDSRFDMCKPDRHVKECMKEITKIDDSIKGTRLDYLARKNLKMIANSVNVTAFKLDKILYLICSEYFYLDDGIKNNSDKYRGQYLKYIVDKI